MNELKNELMQHAARIVKPVNAVQSRKLRMRTDLLTHLEAAVEEELRASAGDESGAIAKAKLRLGDPAELTRSLQDTVPKAERSLLARLPISNRAARLEQRMASVPGQNGAMTMGHKTILSLVANLALLPLCVAIQNVFAASGTELSQPVLAMVAVPLGGMAILLLSCRMLFVLAGNQAEMDWSRALRSAATLVALQLSMAYLVAFSIANRGATLSELTASALSASAVLAVSMLVARTISVLRRPYDQWLTLESNLELDLEAVG